MSDAWEATTVKWNSGEAVAMGAAGGADCFDIERQHQSGIGQLVATKVLPRIAIARCRRATDDPAKGSTFASREVVQFARLAVQADERPVNVFIERAMKRGLSLGEIYLGLLQPAARQLGKEWEADTCDFATVTLGMCQLHRVVREFGPAFQSSHTRRQSGQRALLTPCENEQHSFGLVIVAEFLRRDGWIVTSGPLTGGDGLGEAIRSERFELVGFSLSCDRGVDALARQIRSIRRCSLNRDAWVMVGGRVFLDRPELVARVGADATACDAKQAVTISRKLASLQAEGRA
jgi:MerR family transcriptional regulator, light-induced transcriptional regulator